MPKDITVYTSNNCAYCVMVKKYLTMKGAEYSEINIEEQPEHQQKMMDISGQSRVPVTVVTNQDGSQDVSVGYNLTKLSAAIG